jgi:hypothetical protein
VHLRCFFLRVKASRECQALARSYRATALVNTTLVGLLRRRFCAPKALADWEVEPGSRVRYGARSRDGFAGWAEADRGGLVEQLRFRVRRRSPAEMFDSGDEGLIGRDDDRRHHLKTRPEIVRAQEVRGDLEMPESGGTLLSRTRNRDGIPDLDRSLFVREFSLYRGGKGIGNTGFVGGGCGGERRWSRCCFR